MIAPLAAAEIASADHGWLALWYALAIVSLIAAGIFSGCEIGLYSLSKVRLRLRTSRGDPRAIVLQQWLLNPTYVLEGLLILQNIAGFAFSAAVTRILSIHGFSEFWRGVISIAIVTPMVLVFAEVMPKDLFHSHTDRWTYRLVPALRFSVFLIKVIPVLPLVHFLSRVSLRLAGAHQKTGDDSSKGVGGTGGTAGGVGGTGGGRAEILSLFQESAATGVLTGTQQDLVQRALRLARISIRETMIPWNNVVGVPAAISRDGFRALVRRYNVSRMPVLGRSPSEVLGVVEVIDVLTALATPPATATTATPGTFRLIDHVHPAMTLIGEQSVRSAITLMQKARQTIAVVVDRQGRAVGLVTMKDLVEELVGDLENW